MDLFDFDEKPDNCIYVLDTETTGLYGAPQDVVVDIGITKVDLRDGTVRDAYSAVVGHDVDRWDDYRKNAWIFQNTDMTLDMVREGVPFSKVREDVTFLLKNRNVTAYNVGYDMNKFLYKSPWDLRGTFTECTDIMLAAMKVCKLKSMNYFDDYRYPKLDVAYKMILKGDDPANIHGVQDHRALSDARMASYVMIEMFDNGDYTPYPNYQS
jgi:DNA polymerase-3 subunit epsilon